MRPRPVHRARTGPPGALLGSARAALEPGRIAAGGADAEGERLPPLLEARMRQADRESGLLDVVQPGCLEQLGQLTPARACQVGFALEVGVELARRSPERADRPPAAGMIPDAGRDDPLPPRHAGHLAQARDRICHEVNDELGEGRVEGPVGKRQLFRRCASHVDAGMALANRRHERLRRLDGGHGGRPEPFDQLGGECARAAADVERALPCRHPGEIGELRREQNRIPAHEPVVRRGGDGEAHRRNLRCSRASRGPGGRARAPPRNVLRETPAHRSPPCR